MESVGRHAEPLELAWQAVRHQGSVAVLGIFPQPVLLNLLRPILRARARRVQPYRHNSPDRTIGADDIVFCDFGRAWA